MFYPGVAIAALMGLLIIWLWHEARGDACACGYPRREDCNCLIRVIERKYWR